MGPRRPAGPRPFQSRACHRSGYVTATQELDVATVPMRLEATTLPVADVDGTRWVLQEITERLPGPV